MVMELLNIEEFTYLTDKESGKTKLSLIDYLKEKEIITDTEEEGKYKINVEVLLGKNGITGNGTDGKDVYKLEKNSDSADIEVLYYNGEGESLAIGTLTDLGTPEPEIITFYLGGHSDVPLTAEKGMTFGDWVVSKYNNPDSNPCFRDIGVSFESGYRWQGEGLYWFADSGEVLIDGNFCGYPTGRVD